MHHAPCVLVLLLLAVACGSDPYDGARQDCVDQINSYRATLDLAPYARWTSAEGCTDGQAKADSESGTPHSAFGRCGESAQDECPGWPSIESTTSSCLQMMWAEGPGGGHYENMRGGYSRVACGFHESQGGVWATQNFQ